MAKASSDKRPRAPQGAKRVAQAFFDELGTITEDKQAEVAKAAQAMVRETMMGRREKAKAAKTKMRASKAAPATGKAGGEPERKLRGPKRRPNAAPTRRAKSSEPAPDDTHEPAEAAEES